MIAILLALGVLAYTYRQPAKETGPSNQEASISGAPEENLDGNLKISEVNDQIINDKNDKTKTYEETAEYGEGITHLARKAMKKYFSQQGENPDLAPEHKVYIEDYLQNKRGERWLELGEKISFSSQEIEEAIQKSLGLGQEQLNNLSQFVFAVE